MITIEFIEKSWCFCLTSIVENWQVSVSMSANSPSMMTLEQLDAPRWLMSHFRAVNPVISTSAPFCILQSLLMKPSSHSH